MRNVLYDRAMMTPDGTIHRIPFSWDFNALNALIGVIALLVTIWLSYRGRPKPPHTFIDTPVFKKAQEVALNYNGNPDIFELMHWSCKYGNDLPGRENELSMLRDWACEDARKGVLKTAFISGPGGSGKTRLAAQLAYELNKKKWLAGFLPRSADMTFALPSRHKRYKGVLIIIDYPEERDRKIENILKNISIWHKKTKYPTRILFLTRKDNYEFWGERLRRSLPPYAENLSLNLPALSSLESSCALEIAKSVHDALKDIPPFHSLQPEWQCCFLEWCRRNYGSRCIPLFIISYMINSLLEANMSSDINSPDILRALAHREWQRLRLISEEISFGSEGIPRLLAIATLCGDLSYSKIKDLSKLGVFGYKDNICLDNINKFSGWRKGRIKRLEPDRFAAAFVSVVLLEDENEEVCKWVESAIVEREGEFCVELQRILFDINFFGKKYKDRLINIIRSIVRNSSKKILFDCLVGTQNVLIAPLGVELGEILLKNIEMNHLKRAEIMKNIGSDYDDLGNLAKAISVTEEAKKEVEKVEIGDNEIVLYSSIIHNLSYYKKKSGCVRGAITYIEEVIKIRKNIIKKDKSEGNMFRLASSINNYAMYLMESGFYYSALSKALYAVKIFRNLEIYDYYLGHCYGTIAEILIKMREEILSLKYSRKSLLKRTERRNKFHRDPVYIARGHLLYAESLVLAKMYDEARSEAGKCKELLMGVHESHGDAYKDYFDRIAEIERCCESQIKREQGGSQFSTSEGIS